MKAFLSIATAAGLVGLAALLPSPAPAGPAKTPPRVGAKAPNFSLPADDGKTYRLSGLRGNWVVLAFYPKDETPGCTKEACSLRDEMSTLKSMGAKVLGISLDSVGSHKSFVAKEKLNYPLLADTSKRVTQAYGVLQESGKVARRVTFIIDPKGVIRAVDEGVKPESHGKDLVASLKSLQANWKQHSA